MMKVENGNGKEKKEVFEEQAREKRRNRKFAVGAIAAGAIFTGLVLFGRMSCNGGPVTQEAPMIETIRNDGVCHEELESYPYLRDHRTGKVMCSGGADAGAQAPVGAVDAATGAVSCPQGAGAPVPNPNYSKADCYRGDGVCDSATDRAQLRDPTGGVVRDFPERYLDGRPITLPLEDANSRDCMMAQARQAVCAPLAADRGNLLTRPRLASVDLMTSLVQRTQSQIEDMHAHPDRVRPGDNYYVTPNRYQELCDATLTNVCDPNVEQACSCPNHPDCAPVERTPPTCGNGRLDQGETCDPRIRTGRGSCEQGSRCTGCRRCERLPPPPPTCGNGRQDTGETCDPPNSRCGTNGTCNTSCQCEEAAPPAQQSGPCPDTGGVREIMTDMGTALDSSAEALRERMRAGGAARVQAVLVATVSPDGVVQSVGGNTSCIGDSSVCPTASISTTSVTGNLGIVGTSIGSRPGFQCTISRSRNSAPNQ